MLERKLKLHIQEWIQNGKEALLVTGARQVGKTFLIRECLEESKKEFVEINFIEQPELIQLFKNTKNVNDFLLRLSLATNKKIIKNETIFFFDEIQEVKDIVTFIKFLVDDGSFRYVLSGSLLGVELNDIKSAPVGYMRILDMYPLDFMEFIQSIGIQNNIIEYLHTCFESKNKVDEFIHQKMLDALNLYLIVGGMPQAIVTYLETNDIKRVSQIQKNIVRLYKQDFTKYERKYALKLKEIYDALPSELNQKNKRFQLSKLGKGINFNKVENDFLWLKDAGVVLPVYNISEPTLPLIVNEKRNLFKLFVSDVGLLTSMYSDSVCIQILNQAKGINNGALFENLVAQELVSKGFEAFYYNSKKYGELDFVIERNGKVLPLEIKSGKDYKRHSALNNVLSIDEYAIEQAFIFSQGNVEVEQKRVYLPIYMIMFLKNDTLENSIYKLDLSHLTIH